MSNAIMKKKSSYSQENLIEALSAIRNKTMTYNEAETKFGIPKSTLNCLVYCLVLFSLLPHTSHILQPLGKGIFGPFKSKWKVACTLFLQQYQTSVDKFTFGRVFTGALDQMSNPVIVKNAFRSCGLWPVNENAINYTQMKPAETFPFGDVPETGEKYTAKF